MRVSDCEELLGQLLEHIDRNDTSYFNHLRWILGYPLVLRLPMNLNQSFSLEPLCCTTLLADSERSQQLWRSLATP